MRTRTMYLHTFDGYPATYEPEPWPALIVIKEPSEMYPRAGGTLVRSLRTLLRQQRACIDAQSAKARRGSFDSAHFAMRFGYVRIKVPA